MLLFGYHLALQVHDVDEPFEFHRWSGGFACWLSRTRGWSMAIGWDAAIVENLPGDAPPHSQAKASVEAVIESLVLLPEFGVRRSMLVRLFRDVCGSAHPSPWLQGDRGQFGGGQGRPVIALYLAEASS